jgi:rfaE bifunctional protein nucleotidyltransferase chain/domain
VPHLEKIIPFDSAAQFFAKLRARNVRIVQSHGVFDLIHPGYISHLEEARALGDNLVVTLTADKHVNKGPGRPLFKERLRAQTLAALSCVDQVVIVPFDGAAEVIETIRPHVYCRGKEYEKIASENTSFSQEIAAAEKVGAVLRYVGAESFSSTKFLNDNFDHLPVNVKSFCLALAKECSGTQFRHIVESFSDLKVLVIGDTIFDRYSHLKVQGLTSKNRILSGRFLHEETQTGGALAVFRHVKQFTPHVRYLSLVGVEPWVDPFLAQFVAPHEDKIIRDEAFTTIIKQRFVEPRAEGKELSKLFSVNYISAETPRQEALAKVEAQIRAEIASADVVLLLDFGHGLMQPQLRQLVQESAPLLALNCQTNSNNHGFNIITRQYQRADAFTLDEQELLLSCGHRHVDYKEELAKLQKLFRARYAWLTRGAVQTIGLSEGHESLCPPLETDVVDTIGAGDAFFSVAGLALARKLPVNIATFLGQLAGSQAVKIVGNSHPISKHALIKTGMSLLNF